MGRLQPTQIPIILSAQTQNILLFMCKIKILSVKGTLFTDALQPQRASALITPTSQGFF